MRTVHYSVCIFPAVSSPSCSCVSHSSYASRTCPISTPFIWRVALWCVSLWCVPLRCIVLPFNIALGHHFTSAFSGWFYLMYRCCSSRSCHLDESFLFLSSCSLTVLLWPPYLDILFLWSWCAIFSGYPFLTFPFYRLPPSWLSHVRSWQNGPTNIKTRMDSYGNTT